MEGRSKFLTGVSCLTPRGVVEQSLSLSYVDPGLGPSVLEWIVAGCPVPVLLTLHLACALDFGEFHGLLHSCVENIGESGSKSSGAGKTLA